MWPASTPLSTWTVSRRVSRSAIRPRYSISSASIEVPSASATAMRPRSRASGRNGPSASRSSAAMAGTFTALVTTPPGERGHHLLGGLVAGAVGGLGGGGAEVRRDHHVGIAEQRVVGHRLLAEHVERRARHLAGVERRPQRVLDHQLAARDVDHAHAVLHLREGLGVEPVLGLRRDRQVDRDEVGLRRRGRRSSRRAPRRARGSAPRRRRRRRPPRASRSRARAGPPAGRCGRSRAPRASSRTARRR